MMGSPNPGLGWPQQHDPTQFLTNNFANSTGFEPSRNESDTVAEIFPTSMAFNGTGYTVGNVANGDSDMLQFSRAFNRAGHPDGNALSGGSNQLTSSMVFSGTEYLAGNEVSGGSDQFEYRFYCLPEYERFFSADFSPGKDI
ncbi:hypothetical protein JRO89_XS10G0041000 [Xanthoceras sorbifolium]|uniref:Uncharacterized protein n=1 Tax=Xanthoceras sorbifolium TaxID=99658 RepID=A0ABQ8HHL6_9ROSI|nr:hypothetical protein JRO89_XS10G0041000 [Xanthoceras sorbifolium]